MEDMKMLKKILFCCLPAVLWILLPTGGKAQYQFGYLSYQKALQNMPEYATAQTSLRALKDKYDTEAKYNEERFRKMFADFLSGQKNFPQEIMLKRQKELQVAMEQGISFRKDAERMLNKAEQEMMVPVTHKLDSILSIIGHENGFIFIINTDNHDFPFIHTQAGKDLNEIAIARITGKVLPTTTEGTPATEEKASDPNSKKEEQPAAPAQTNSENKQ
jgi:outer membrane protein